MSKAVVFFADGTEECEALLVVDLLRRAKVEVIVASAMGFGDAACDGGQSVAVAAEGYRRAESILEICAFQKRSNGLRHRLLTAFYMMIGWANFVAGAAEIIAEFPLHIRFDVRLAMSGAGKVNRRGGGLRALDALRMVVTYLGGEPRQTQRFRHVLRQPCGR